MRSLLYSQAVCEALDIAMSADERVYVMGLGVTDPKAIFGTTSGLEAKFGPRRVLDMPCAENGMTGVGIGSALAGMRPVMVHQRMDFALLALDQIANVAAKWSYMFAGRRNVPIVIRLIIGRGWGQGPQHSQSLHATFAHFPGLKVVMPATPHDAKGMLLAAIDDPDPVIFVEHRWLHGTFGIVPEDDYRVPLDRAAIARTGRDVTIVASSLARNDALRAAEVLELCGIDAEIVDLRAIKPLDLQTVASSVIKTGRLVAVDHGWRTLGLAGEIIASMSEMCYDALLTAPRRVTAPDAYVATSPSLAASMYPDALTITNVVLNMFGIAPLDAVDAGLNTPHPIDVPDPSFRGPF